MKEQVLRFARLFGAAIVASVPAALSGGTPLTKAAIIGVLVGAAEVAFRQWRPVTATPPSK
jgi:hypothetical protein